MKKYLIPLILIFVLFFVFVGDCAWLSGYDQRIKLTVDSSKVDATLSNFPVTVFFTAAQAEEIFAEFDADSDYMKCAFTTSDGETQLYAEKELFNIYNSQYPPAHSDTYVKATSTYSVNYYPHFATDPAKSLTGTPIGTNWVSECCDPTNQRFHIDLGSAKVINKIYYENSHSSGSDTNQGVQNFTFWGSNTGAGSFDDLVYANDEGWTQLTTSQATFDQHVAADQADPKYITVTNTTAYRYYAFKFADNHGDANYMGVRRIELQGSEAIYNVKVPTIASGAGTDIYYYYDNDHADNTTYIGAINTTAGGNVWDANFKAVYHMVDATTSTIVDSTSNSNDGTKKGANEPIEAAGKVGQGQDFDGSNDYITLPSSNDLTPASGTAEILVKRTSSWAVDEWDATLLWCKPNGTYNGNGYFISVDNRPDPDWAAVGVTWDSTEAITYCYEDPNDFYPLDTYIHLAVKWTSGGASAIYKNGVSQSITDGFTSVTNSGDNSWIGFSSPTYNSGFTDSEMDEIRISSVARPAAWIKATYNSLWDTLLTYGSEENAPSGEEDNAIFFGMAF